MTAPAPSNPKAEAIIPHLTSPTACSAAPLDEAAAAPPELAEAPAPADRLAPADVALAPDVAPDPLALDDAEVVVFDDPPETPVNV